ncbi:MAG: cbb3-type cytochrome oxidase assembly protein CcoS [Bdellovibrionales bacterium]
MSVLIYLIPIALLLGLIGLVAFIWTLKSGQYEDMDGAAQRVLLDDDEKNHKNPNDI